MRSMKETPQTDSHKDQWNKDGTKVAIGKITTGLKWKPVQESMILHGEYRPVFEDQCEELGMLMAASLESGII